MTLKEPLILIEPFYRTPYRTRIKAETKFQAGIKWLLDRGLCCTRLGNGAVDCSMPGNCLGFGCSIPCHSDPRDCNSSFGYLFDGARSAVSRRFESDGEISFCTYSRQYSTLMP